MLRGPFADLFLSPHGALGVGPLSGGEETNAFVAEAGGPAAGSVRSGGVLFGGLLSVRAQWASGRRLLGVSVLSCGPLGVLYICVA